MARSRSLVCKSRFRPPLVRATADQFEAKAQRYCPAVASTWELRMPRRWTAPANEAKTQTEIICAEILNARYRQVIICIKVNDGICAGHLDIQVAKVVDVIGCQSGEVNVISPLFKIGRVMPILSGERPTYPRQPRQTCCRSQFRSLTCPCHRPHPARSPIRQRR